MSKDSEMLRVFTTIGIPIVISFFCVLILQNEDSSVAYGHFFGENVTRNGYQIVFQPFPFAPLAGDNTTLNFSILDEENLNINNIFSALTIRDKQTNETIEQIPYEQYLYSDITFPYRFENNSDYLITLETRIIGDSKYQAQPLTATFDLTVGDQISESFRTIMIYYVTPTCAAIIIAVLFYEIHWKRKKARKENM